MDSGNEFDTNLSILITAFKAPKLHKLHLGWVFLIMAAPNCSNLCDVHGAVYDTLCRPTVRVV